MTASMSDLPQHGQCYELKAEFGEPSELKIFIKGIFFPDLLSTVGHCAETLVDSSSDTVGVRP